MRKLADPGGRKRKREAMRGARKLRRTIAGQEAMGRTTARAINLAVNLTAGTAADANDSTPWTGH
jgi:hypothetical protein